MALSYTVQTKDEVTAVSTGGHMVATSVNSFSPPAGSLVCISAAWLDYTDQLGKTFTCVDNHGNSYSYAVGGPGGDADGGCYLLPFQFKYTSAPGATTVKITASDNAAADCLIQPYIFTGQAASQSTAANNKFSEVGTATTTYEIALTPTVLGSQIIVLAAPNHNSGLTGPVTSIAGTTTDVDWDDSTAGSRGTAGHATSLTSSLTSTTYGWTSVNQSPFGYGVMAYEVLPAGGASGSLSISLRVPTVTLFGTVQNEQLAITVPNPATALSGKVQHVGSLTVSLPKPATSLTGGIAKFVGSLSINLPVPKTSITAAPIITQHGSLVIVLPPGMRIQLESGPLNIVIPTPGMSLRGNTQYGNLNIVLGAPQFGLTGVAQQTESGVFNVKIPRPNLSLLGINGRETGVLEAVLVAPVVDLAAKVTHNGSFTINMGGGAHLFLTRYEMFGAETHGTVEAVLPEPELALTGEVGHLPGIPNWLRAKRIRKERRRTLRGARAAVEARRHDGEEEP